MAMVVPPFSLHAEGRKSKLVAKEKCMPGETVSLESWGKKMNLRWPVGRSDYTAEHVARWMASFLEQRPVELLNPPWAGLQNYADRSAIAQRANAPGDDGYPSQRPKAEEGMFPMKSKMSEFAPGSSMLSFVDDLILEDHRTIIRCKWRDRYRHRELAYHGASLYSV